ncbi:hypothetical protein CAP31_06630 [Sulfuriferula sp. AH1]|uniref:metal ABC transporter permease n=1 Tax=Sulfuriferula sp. AH1 TaxID=1985873 RepID=UPI000B3B9F41|nr:metal ABC transporter permease [Sulfuriferula sp. AH1]ARU31387.1 hypothetical protein CAP31_06630 [Sulfuriferula sp. AH1]
MNVVFQLLIPPFIATLLLTVIHTYLGIHVLRRNVIFVDLALAQISAFGATVAFMLGHMPQSAAVYGYSLFFTLLGAALLSFSRHWSGKVSQETFVGIIYVACAAAAFLLIDKAPQGAEHIKQLLIGSILTITNNDLIRLATLYGFVGLFHWVFRKQFVMISFNPEQAREKNIRLWLWDFLFYASFGVVVTSSVAIGGVLLVFSFLIIPSVIGVLYATSILSRLLIGWIAGALAGIAGLGTSYLMDLPTGATMVVAFAGTLVIAAIMRPFFFTSIKQKIGTLIRYIKVSAILIVVVSLASSAWLILFPHADQPLLEIMERQSPCMLSKFLSAGESKTLLTSRNDERHYYFEAHRLIEKERDSRWQGAGLTDEELRSVSSYTQVFQEMQKGEEFVQQEILEKARGRQRWIIGIPLLMISFGFLLILLGNENIVGTPPF